MLYTWAGIYYSLIVEGKNYDRLKPVISIWILNGSLFQDTNEYHLPFLIYNPEHKIVLSDHMAIHVLQLPKWIFGPYTTAPLRGILHRRGPSMDPFHISRQGRWSVSDTFQVPCDLPCGTNGGDYGGCIRETRLFG